MKEEALPTRIWASAAVESCCCEPAIDRLLFLWTKANRARGEREIEMRGI